MVRGNHVAQCAHCGKEWITGDCITFTCRECWCQGHRNLPWIDDPQGCPVCQAEWDALRSRLDRPGEEQPRA